MKRILVGGIFLFVGSLLSVLLTLYVSVNLVMEWHDSLGRFLTTARSLEVEKILIVGFTMMVLGSGILLAEYVISLIEYIKRITKSRKFKELE